MYGELRVSEHLRLPALDNSVATPPIPSALHPKMATTMASADFSLRVTTSLFQAQGEISPGKNALLHCTTAGFTPLRLDHKSFAVTCPLALLSNAFYPVLVHQLAVYAPRFLPTFGRPHAVALHFVRRDQLTAGLAPAGVRPCWAHKWSGRHTECAGPKCGLLVPLGTTNRVDDGRQPGQQITPSSTHPIKAYKIQ